MKTSDVYRRCAFCLAGAFLTPSPSAAQGDTARYDEIKVLGTRLPAPVPQPAEVITSGDIDASFALSITEMLRELPGITAIEPGGAGGFPELYLRGADPNFTVVFVDGVRMNDPTDPRGGAFDFATIAPGEVERVELVRGPFSALYGSGALAGAINIDTRRPAASPGGDARLAAGSDGYLDAGGRIAGPLGAGSGGLHINYVDSGEPTPGSTRTVASAGASYDRDLSDTLSAEVSLRASDRERTSYPVASGGPRLSVTRELESAAADDLSMGASLAWGREARSFAAHLTLLQRDELTVSPAIPDGVFSGVPAAVSDTDLDRYGLVLESRFTLAGLQFGAGVEYQREEGTVIGELDLGGFRVPTDFSADRTTVSPFVEARAGVSRATTLFAGLRYDDFSDVDAELSPRVGVAWQHGEDGPALTAAWGEARKSPSFYALGDPLVGNPDLAAEDSNGVDVSVTLPLSQEALSLTLSAYRYRYTNLVDFDFAAFRLVNRSGVDTGGVELRLEGAAGERLQWLAFAARHENEVDGVEDALLHRPEFSAGAHLTWTPNERWSLSASVDHEGDRPSSSIPGGAETLASYTRFDVALMRRLAANLDLRIGVDNLFDADYEAVAGFPAPGRQARVGVRQRF